MRHRGCLFESAAARWSGHALLLRDVDGGLSEGRRDMRLRRTRGRRLLLLRLLVIRVACLAVLLLGAVGLCAILMVAVPRIGWVALPLSWLAIALQAICNLHT